MSHAVPPERLQRPHRGAVLALAIVTIGWAIAFARRLAVGVSNVDDYLYTDMATDFRNALVSGPVALVEAWQRHEQNSPLIPTLAAPLTALSSSPHVLVLVQLPLLLLLTASIAWLLHSLGLTWPRAWLGAALTAILPATLWYSVMVHFALACALFTTTALAAYLSSDRLASRRFALVFGASFGVLLLSRVVALVYVAAIAIAVGVDLIARGWDEHFARRLINLALAAGVCLLLAGPWWLVDGPGTLKYLIGFGLSDESTWTSQQTPLGKVALRLNQTVHESGLVTFVLTVTLAAAFTARRMREQRSRAATLVVIGTAFLTFVLLAVSSSVGTGFALPAVVLLGTLAWAWLLEPNQQRMRWLQPALACVSILAAVLALALPWTPKVGEFRVLMIGPPAAAQVGWALGCQCAAGQEQVNDEVVRAAAGTPVTILRTDAIVNEPSLEYTARVGGVDFQPTEVAMTDLAGDRSALRDVGAVIAGQTLQNYLPLQHADLTHEVLAQEGFALVYEHRFSEQNTVEVWRRPGR